MLEREVERKKLCQLVDSTLTLTMSQNHNQSQNSSIPSRSNEEVRSAMYQTPRGKPKHTETNQKMGDDDPTRQRLQMLNSGSDSRLKIIALSDLLCKKESALTATYVTVADDDDYQDHHNDETSLSSTNTATKTASTSVSVSSKSNFNKAAFELERDIRLGMGVVDKRIRIYDGLLKLPLVTRQKYLTSDSIEVSGKESDAGLRQKLSTGTCIGIPTVTFSGKQKTPTKKGTRSNSSEKDISQTAVTLETKLATLNEILQKNIKAGNEVDGD